PKLHLSRYSVHNVTDDLKLMAAKDTYDSRDELLLVKQHNTEQLFASLTPFLIGHLEESKCSNCIAYNIEIEGDPELRFESEPIDSVYAVSKVSRKEGPLNITLQLSSNKQFYDSYSQVSILGTVVASLVLATLLTIFLY
ncbi:EAL domain-containing protein, partial [Vibrio sp. 10N.222.55.C6]